MNSLYSGNTLKARQISLFFFAFLPVIKIFSLPSLLASVSEQDAWLSFLLSFGVDIIAFSIIIFCSNRTGFNAFEVIENVFGKNGKKVILYLYVLFFTLKAIVPLFEQSSYIKLTLYEEFPSGLPFLCFFVFSFFLCLKPLRVLGRLADIMWFLTAFGFLILFGLSIGNADFSSVLPIGASGSGIVNGAYKSYIWCGDAVYMFFFSNLYKSEKKDNLKIYTGFVLSALLPALFMVVFYGIFGSIAHRQTFALTEISKYSTVINNVGRLDYLGILFILSSHILSVSVSVYFATALLETVTGLKRYICSIITNGVLFIVLMFLGEFYLSMFDFLSMYGNAFFLTMSTVLPVSICLISILKRRKEVAFS